MTTSTSTTYRYKDCQIDDLYLIMGLMLLLLSCGNWVQVPSMSLQRLRLSLPVLLSSAYDDAASAFLTPGSDSSFSVRTDSAKAFIRQVTTHHTPLKDCRYLDTRARQHVTEIR